METGNAKLRRNRKNRFSKEISEKKIEKEMLFCCYRKSVETTPETAWKDRKDDEKK